MYIAYQNEEKRLNFTYENDKKINIACSRPLTTNLYYFPNGPFLS